MKRGQSKERKTYQKPSYQAERILEKMSLVCRNAPKNCKTSIGPCASGEVPYS